MADPDVHRHPAWFGAVMGTAATSIVLLLQGEIWSLAWLTDAAVVLLVLASVLAVLLWPRYMRRLRDLTALRRELADPVTGPLLATLPAGVLLLASDWGRAGSELVPASVALWVNGILLIAGAVLVLVYVVSWLASASQGAADLGDVNGGWLMPAVTNMLVADAMLPLIARFPEQAPWLIVVAACFLGIGAILAMALFTLLLARIALRPPAPAVMAPTYFIPLSAAGLVGFTLLRLLEAAQQAAVPGFTSVTFGIVVAMMGVGIGLWWALVATVALVRVRRGGRLPVHPGWWGFVFPFAAMAMSISSIGQAFDTNGVGASFVDGAGAAAAALVVATWLVVAWRTVPLVASSRSR